MNRPGGVGNDLLEMLERQLGGSDWRIGKKLATWYRPNHDELTYPYLPRHITLPKEEKRYILVEMDKDRELNVPNGYLLLLTNRWKALAVPLFELYGNETRYGAEIASVACQISGFTLEFDE